jgi:hypothetical protein
MIIYNCELCSQEQKKQLFHMFNEYYITKDTEPTRKGGLWNSSHRLILCNCKEAAAHSLLPLVYIHIYRCRGSTGSAKKNLSISYASWKRIRTVNIWTSSIKALLVCSAYKSHNDNRVWWLQYLDKLQITRKGGTTKDAITICWMARQHQRS